jgi:hypothetical protein
MTRPPQSVKVSAVLVASLVLSQASPDSVCSGLQTLVSEFTKRRGLSESIALSIRR